MTSKAGEISSIIKEQIKQYESKIEMKENGTVITVGDGIATVYGLRSCMANELLRFEDGSFGVAQNLEEETVSVAILSDKDSIQEGSLVYRSGEALSVPVGEGLLGRVVNALGEPIDGKGPVETDGIRPIEAIAAGTHGGRIHDAVERDHRHFGGAAADIHMQHPFAFRPFHRSGTSCRQLPTRLCPAQTMPPSSGWMLSSCKTPLPGSGSSL